MHLEDRKLKRIESVSPAINTLLIILTSHSTSLIPLPERSQRPRAKLLRLTRIRAFVDSRWESHRLHTVLHPLNHRLHIDSWIRTRLKCGSRAVSRTWDDEESVPWIEGSNALVVAHTRIHDGTDRVVVMY